MHRSLFSFNLRNETVADEFRRALSPVSYLLSPPNSTRNLVNEAIVLMAKGCEVILDNGNFSVCGDLISMFRKRVDDALTERSDRPSQLNGIAKQIEAVALESVGTRRRLSAGLSLTPSRVIGEEDVTLAVLLSLGIIDRLDLPGTKIRSINEQVAQAAIENQAMGSRTSRRYAVASAYDYGSAFIAGQVFGRHAIRNVAMGFGAFMSDDSYVEQAQYAGKTIRLDEGTPNRYIRTASVARGFFDGYASTPARSPKAFHCLGLGAPMMMGLVRLAGWGVQLMSFDSTSPIKDAISGSLYTMRPAYLKLDCTKIAGRLAASNGRWSCPCRFCRSFTAEYPFDYEMGHQWFVQNKRFPTYDDLKRGTLSKAFPLLAQYGVGVEARRRALTCMGHNHWVVAKVVAGIERNSGTKNALLHHVKRVIEMYEENTTAPFARALRAAEQIITQ